MSARHKVQDPSGVVITTDNDLYVYVVRTAAPVGGETNYIPGALWANKNGSAGSALYLNQGTTTSATWLNIG